MIFVPERSKEVMEKQTLARGMVSDNLDTSVQAAPSSLPIQIWQSQSYADPLFSSADFASMMMVDCHAALSSFGNHTCRHDVCHKGRIGKMGFCRMMFWHWRIVDDGKKASAKTFHDMKLQEKWDGAGMPLIQVAPPHNGAPALEITHPFHMKLTPAIAAGPRSNHDRGVLLTAGHPRGRVRGLRHTVVYRESCGCAHPFG